MKVPLIVSSHRRLTLGIFADVFHTDAEASSIIFDLRRQFFADAKIFELERLQSFMLNSKVLL